MLGRVAIVSVLFAAAGLAQPNGQQLVMKGGLDAALEVFRAQAASNPKSLAANNGAGVVLDLMGRTKDARPYFAAAIKAARTDGDRAVAERAMAVSFAFSSDCKGA